MNTYDCERFRDELADCLDETLSPAAAEHLAGCDACRDLRHDARLAARAVSRAGADHAPTDPEVLARSVLAALDARGTPRPADPPRVVELPRVERTVPMARVPSPPPAPVAADRSGGERPPPARGGVKRVLGAFAAIAAAAVAVVALRPETHRADDTTASQNQTVAWQGTVARVLRAGTDAAAGMQVQRAGATAWEDLAERAAIAPGSALRTDPRTRARVELSDGTVLVLDRGTELRMDPRAARTASLVRGSLVADVAHTDAPARIKTESGDVEVLGTRFALTATEDRTSVRVTRGAVRLADARGAVEVKAGQEGTVDKGAVPLVAPAVDLAGSFAWSEFGEARAEARDTAVVGLGELRARRPGSTTERDQAVRLERHAVKVRVVGNVARTEVEQVFRNESGETLEGIYRFPLPPDAQVEDLALDVDGRMESGAFVERDRAAAIWRGAIRQGTPQRQRVVEEFVWVPGPWRDPALLEWQRGGRFELRVYPIPARGSRRVRIAYTQTVPVSSGVRRYTYPLAHDPAGSTRVEQFDVDVQVLGSDARRGVRATGYPLREAQGDGRRMSFSQRDFVPAGDLTVEYATPDPGAMTAWAFDPAGADGAPEDAYVAIALRPQLPRWGEVRPRDYVLVVDASRSMTGERYARASRLASAVVSEMDRRDRFTVLACDTRCRELPGGAQAASSEGARAALRFLQGVEPAGATDVTAQVRAALGARGVGGDGRDVRVVYVGDGVSTAGFRRPERVASAVRAQLASSAATLTAVAVGVDADVIALQAIARAGGGAMVPYVPGEPLAAASLGVLEATWGAALREPEVELPAGLTAVAPRVLPTLRAGSEAVIVARMSSPQVSGEVVLRGTVGGERFESRHALALASTRDAGNAFVPRLYAAARVADLDREEGEAPKQEAVRLSQRFRVPSRHTSLLVLESAAMFRAFGLDRTSAAPQWTGEEDSVAAQTAGVVGADEPDGSLDDLVAAATEASGARETRGRSGGGGFGAPAASPARARRQEQGSVLGDMANEAPAASAPAARGESERMSAAIARPFPRDPRGGQWMQRVWVRRATVSAARGDGLADAPSSVASQVDRARRALAENADSRDRHRELFRWLSVAGELAEAAQVADRWAARDPLDADALARKADVLARGGRRDEAIRTLEGTADARPDDVAVLERLAQMHERAGDVRAACAWRVSLAEVRPRDAQHLARALRCLGNTGEGSMRSRVLDGAEASLRAEAERLAGLGVPSSPVRGEVQVSASWYGGEDLDIALIDPRGVRLSWQGGRAGITAQDATRGGRESLGLSRASTGEWTVEIVRTANDPADDDEPLRGEVTLTVLGERRTVPFTLQGARARVARASVTRESQLVPADHGPPPGSRIVW